MNKSDITPISGDHFEDFLLLTNPDHKSTKTKQAWHALQQQTQTHVPSTKSIDLNRICVDTIRMELLIFPVVEHWKRPLTNTEWNHIDKESVLLGKQMEKMRKLSILVRKKDPLSFPDIAPLFNKLFKHNKELRNNWDEFKQAWSNYKKDWQIFQMKKSQVRKSKHKSAKTLSVDSANNSSNEENITPPVSPPMFPRDRWHALRVGSKALEVEVLHQCQRFRNVTKHDLEEIKEATHPGVKFLVEELRKIYLKTHGFELIKRVKLVQERNDQLMQELQPYFPEPIISAKMLEKTKHSFKLRERSAAGSKNENKSEGKFLRKIFLIILFIFLGTFLIFLFQNQLNDRDQFLFILRYGLIPSDLFGSPFREIPNLISSSFLHGSPLHLVSNMFFLYVFGDNVENRLGHFGFLGFYLFGSIIAGLVHANFASSSFVPMVGASGAVSAVL